MRRPDRHNEIELNFLPGGWLTYLLGGRKVRVERGRLSVFWAAIPHQIVDYRDTAEYFVATLPLAWFLQRRFPERFVQSLLHGRVITDASSRRASSDKMLFADWEQDLGTKDAARTSATLLEIEARLLRLSLSAAGAEPERQVLGRRRGTVGEGGSSKVEQMAGLIARRYSEPLTVDLIAGAVKLHPNYAMNLFRRVFGTTLIDYVTQHRVSHAQRLLATTDMKVVDVAVDAGFGSLSRFNEAFRASCGRTPREYRRQNVGSPVSGG